MLLRHCSFLSSHSFSASPASRISGRSFVWARQISQPKQTASMASTIEDILRAKMRAGESNFTIHEKEWRWQQPIWYSCYAVQSLLVLSGSGETAARTDQWSPQPRCCNRVCRAHFVSRAFQSDSIFASGWTNLVLTLHYLMSERGSHWCRCFIHIDQAHLWNRIVITSFKLSRKELHTNKPLYLRGSKQRKLRLGQSQDCWGRWHKMMNTALDQWPTPIGGSRSEKQSMECASKAAWRMKIPPVSSHAFLTLNISWVVVSRLNHRMITPPTPNMPIAPLQLLQLAH